MGKRLLVAVDGSPAANAALLKAIELARAGDSELRIVNVIDETLVPWDDRGFPQRQRALNGLGRASEKILGDAQDTARRAGRDASAEQLVRDRWPQSVGALISAAARNWGADMIVIGSRGHSPVLRSLLGSVDSAVMRTAAMPVLPVTAAGQSSAPRPGELRSVAPHRVGLAG